MDGSSSIAGLIGLAALLLQTAFQTSRTIKKLKGLPDSLKGALNWLETLVLLLKHVQSFPPDAPVEQSQVNLLTKHGQTTLKAVQGLSDKVKAEIAFLERSGTIIKPIRKVKILFCAKDIEDQIEEVRRAIEALQLCYSEISK
jgi:hypothetical protein